MVSKKLVIAEKPNAGRTMARVLGCDEEHEGYLEGQEYVVTWADGHLVGMKYPEEVDAKYKTWNVADLPITIDTEKLLYVLPEKEKQFEIIKKLIHREDVTMLINAGDAAREGYLIQHWIYKMAENTKPVKVLWASSLTEGALKKAFANLRDPEEFVGVLEEGLARAERDYLMGINYSRLLTGKRSSDLTLPYGRCMTTLLNMIVQRDKSIESFVPDTTYSIQVTYKNGMKGTLLGADGKKLAFDSEDAAEKILKQIEPEGMIVSYEGAQTTEGAGCPVDLSELQRRAGQKYGYEPSKTLAIAQKLYDTYHLITYPRTNSRYLSSDLREEIEKYRENCCFGKFRMRYAKWASEGNQIADFYFDDSKIEDHHAILPDLRRNADRIYMKLQEEEKNIYDEVVWSFLALFCREYCYQSAKIMVVNAGYMFQSNEKVIKDHGCRGMFLDKEPELLEEFHDLDVEDKIALTAAEVKKDVSAPPTRFNVGNIIEGMQRYRIGTPATMAATIDKLVKAKYPFVVLRKGKYYSTPFGRKYIELVPDELKSLDISILFEEELEEIRITRRAHEIYRQNVIDEIVRNMDLLEEKRVSLKPYIAVAGRKAPGKKRIPMRRQFHETKQ